MVLARVSSAVHTSAMRSFNYLIGKLYFPIKNRRCVLDYLAPLSLSVFYTVSICAVETNGQSKLCRCCLRAAALFYSVRFSRLQPHWRFILPAALKWERSPSRRGIHQNRVNAFQFFRVFNFTLSNCAHSRSMLEKL
jgi:hypothetical protein